MIASTLIYQNISARPLCPRGESAAPPNLVSFANLLSIPSSPASKSFLKTLKKIGPKMEPYGTPLLTGCQSDVSPFTLWAQPVNQLFDCFITYLSSCVLVVLSRRILWEAVLKALLKRKIKKISSTGFPVSSLGRWYCKCYIFLP